MRRSFYSTLHACRAFRGYGILVSVILLSASLTSALLLASAHQFATRYGQLQQVNAAHAELLALACVYAAIQAFAENPAYSPHDALTPIDASDSCYIESLSFSGTTLSVLTYASIANTTIRLSAAAQANPDGTFTLIKTIRGTGVPP